MPLLLQPTPSPEPPTILAKLRHAKRVKAKHSHQWTDRFSDKELLFVDLFLQFADKDLAFKKAGFASADVAKESWKILHKPKIQRLLKQRREADERSKDIGAPYVLETIKAEIDYLKANPERSAAASQAILRAAELLGKACGCWIERIEEDKRITVTIERIG